MSNPGSPTESAKFADGERLFHYTNAQGLYGILESSCLWATHFQFLNDSREFYAAKASITKTVESTLLRHLAALKVNGYIEVSGGEPLKALASDEAQRFVKIMYSALFGSDEYTAIGSDAFVFSAFRSPPSRNSFADGELLHWATYGRNGGYALQLDPAKLEVLLAVEKDEFSGLPYIFEPTSYASEGSVPPDLIEAYEELCAAAITMADYQISPRITPVPDYAKAGGAFMHIISRTKDVFFQSEAEARIVVFRLRSKKEGFTPHSFHVRHAAALPVPYIKLFEKRLFGELLPIERIVIGPHPESERRRFVLREFLRQAGLLDRIEITISGVPYVNVSPAS